MSDNSKGKWYCFNFFAEKSDSEPNTQELKFEKGKSTTNKSFSEMALNLVNVLVVIGIIALILFNTFIIVGVAQLKVKMGESDFQGNYTDGYNLTTSINFDNNHTCSMAIEELSFEMVISDDNGTKYLEYNSPSFRIESNEIKTISQTIVIDMTEIIPIINSTSIFIRYNIHAKYSIYELNFQLNINATEIIRGALFG